MLVQSQNHCSNNNMLLMLTYLAHTVGRGHNIHSFAWVQWFYIAESFTPLNKDVTCNIANFEVNSEHNHKTIAK